MRPIIRTTLALTALTAVAVLGAPTAGAHAGAPTTTTFDYGDSFTTDPGDLCAFAVDFSFHDVGYASVVTTGQGSTETDHVTETDTMSAFGRSVTGLPYTYIVQGRFDADQQLVGLQAQGVTWSFLLPDGTRVHAAGYVDWLNGVVRGDQVDLAPVCAYLGG